MPSSVFVALCNACVYVSYLTGSFFKTFQHSFDSTLCLTSVGPFDYFDVCLRSNFSNYAWITMELTYITCVYCRTFPTEVGACNI